MLLISKGARMTHPDNKNGIIGFIAKVSPAIFIALTVSSIAWIGSNSMQTNVTLAVMSNDMVQLKEQIKSASNDRYTNTQAMADRTYYLSEMDHLKDSLVTMDLRMLRAEQRVLELERSKK